MKRWKGAALLLLCTVAMLRLLQGLAQPEKENAHVPVLGIVTTAAEDDRREAQSEALVHAAEEHGFKVLEMPVERTQEAQIEAVRALIVYQVDAIAFTPLVESGWDNVLREAKSASVPLLSIDRAIRGVDDVPLQHIGFDYASLAEQAADALLQQRMPRDGVLELYGTVNAFGCKRDCTRLPRVSGGTRVDRNLQPVRRRNALARLRNTGGDGGSSGRNRLHFRPE